ncbi:hypothetical protein P6F34_gp38 [Pseudomonas phage MiCath]|uniref:Uncharacterized protein n=1 Tax=Pseudomonas phage MiCath TaxID=3003729 RepID=A0AAF0AEK4_9CAUD|nr:hypothetical protein P6F34_gp38 [Pseudomonas phage MiCath]WAX22390.1 hypothetical protein [Pseudomonas phage MiCath]
MSACGSLLGTQQGLTMAKRYRGTGLAVRCCTGLAVPAKIIQGFACTGLNWQLLYICTRCTTNPEKTYETSHR